MNRSTTNRWSGKSTDEVLAEFCHEVRGPIYNAVGFLNVLKSAGQLSLSAEPVQGYIESALHNALQAQEIVDSVIHYMNEQRKDP